MADPNKRFCSYCGAPLQAGAEFCAECGTPAEAETPAEPAFAPNQTPLDPVRTAATPAAGTGAAPTPPQTGYTPMQTGYTPPQTGYTPVQPGYTPAQPGYGTAQPEMTGAAGYYPGGWSGQPQKKNRTLLYVLIGAATLIAITLIIVFAVIVPGQKSGTSANPQDPSSVVVGTWSSYRYYNASTDLLQDLPQTYAVLTLNADGSGNLSGSNGANLAITWSYNGTNSSGNYQYTIQAEGEQNPMAYVVNANEPARAGDLWLAMSDTDYIVFTR